MVDAYPCKTYDQIYSNQFYHHPLLFWLLTEFPKCVTILYIYYKKKIFQELCVTIAATDKTWCWYILWKALCAKSKKCFCCLIFLGSSKQLHGPSTQETSCEYMNTSFRKWCLRHVYRQQNAWNWFLQTFFGIFQ